MNRSRQNINIKNVKIVNSNPKTWSLYVTEKLIKRGIQRYIRVYSF